MPASSPVAHSQSDPGRCGLPFQGPFAYVFDRSKMTTISALRLFHRLEARKPSTTRQPSAA